MTTTTIREFAATSLTAAKRLCDALRADGLCSWLSDDGIKPNRRCDGAYLVSVESRDRIDAYLIGAAVADWADSWVNDIDPCAPALAAPPVALAA